VSDIWFDAVLRLGSPDRTHLWTEACGFKKHLYARLFGSPNWHMELPDDIIDCMEQCCIFSFVSLYSQEHLTRRDKGGEWGRYEAAGYGSPATETNYPDLFIAWGSKAIQEGDGVVVPIDIGEGNETSDAFIVRPTQKLNGDGTISSYRLIGHAIILRPYRRDFAGIFGIARVDIWLE
jgi:hypothetical protein